MPAHPPLLTGGVADHQGVIGDVFGHHAASGDETVASEGDTADDGGVCADGRTATDQGLFVQAVPVDLAAGIGNVGQNTGWSQENIVFDDRAGVDGDVVLDLDVVADDHAVGNVHVLSKDTTLADLRALLDVAEVPDFGARADDGAVVDVR